MEPYIILPAFREKAIFSHQGEEFIDVLEGPYEFAYDGKNFYKRHKEKEVGYEIKAFG